jgi:hypothetical protein
MMMMMKMMKMMMKLVMMMKMMMMMKMLMMMMMMMSNNTETQAPDFEFVNNVWIHHSLGLFEPWDNNIADGTCFPVVLHRVSSSSYGYVPVAVGGYF